MYGHGVRGSASVSPPLHETGHLPQERNLEGILIAGRENADRFYARADTVM